MSYESNIAATSHFFAGEDKTLSFEVLSADGVTMENVASFKMEWNLRRRTASVAPFRGQGAIVVTKSTETAPPGITVTGVYNSSRAVNTQRVVVAIADTDTESLTGDKYVHSLKRMDDGIEAVLSHGTVELLVAAVR